MFWVALVAGEILAGAAACYHVLRNRVDPAVVFGLAFPVGMGLSSLLFFVISAFIGFNWLHVVLHSCGLIGVSVVSLRKMRLDGLKNRADVAFAVISVVVALGIVPSMYPSDVDVHASFRLDIAEEIALINSFRWGANGGFVNLFKIRHPACYKCVARSRWMTAVNSAMMMVGGAGLRVAMMVPSLLLVVSMCFLLQKLAAKFVKMSAVCLLLFLFCGGLGFFEFFEDGVRMKRDLDFVFDLGTRHTEWSHPLFHYMFPYRPSQLALCLVIGMMIVVSGGLGKREFAFVGMVLGLLPAVQHQVFIGAVIYVSLYVGFVLLMKQVKWREMASEFITFAVFFSIPGFFTLVHYLPRATNASLVTKNTFWEPLTKRGAFFAPLAVWWQALGPFVVVVLVVSWFVIQRDLVMLFAPACVVFVIGNLYQFQEYNRHSIILFYPLWMTPAVIVFVATFEQLVAMIRSEQGKGVITGMGIVLVVCSTASGMLGFVRLRKRHSKAITSDMETAAAWIAGNTPRKAVFISSAADYDIVVQLAGKVSYLHHPWFATRYGFQFGGVDRNKEIESFINESDSNILPKVKYVVNTAGQSPERHLVHWGRGNWSKVYASPTVTIFQRGAN